MLVLGVAVLSVALAIFGTGTAIIQKSQTDENRRAGKGLIYAGLIFAGFAMFIFSICTDRVIFEIFLIQIVIIVCALRIFEEIKE